MLDPDVRPGRAGDPPVYRNRELSWLAFNERVLEEAACEDTPPLERLRFASIFTSNLDEFYMIRVGSLLDQCLLSDAPPDNKTGMSPREQLACVYKRTADLLVRRDAVFRGVMRCLHGCGIAQAGRDGADDNETFCRAYFDSHMRPKLSVQTAAVTAPLPHLAGKQLCIGAWLGAQDGPYLGIVPVGRALERVVALPSPDVLRFTLAEDLLLRYADELFPSFTVLEKAVFCVTRNADLSADERLYDEDVDYRLYMREIVKKRENLSPVRLEIQRSDAERDPCPQLREFLRGRLRLCPEQVFLSDGPLEMSYTGRLEALLPAPLRQKLQYAPFTPAVPPSARPKKSMLEQALGGDLLLRYPYESMKPLLRLVHEASADPRVESIAITLYRVGPESKLIEALIDAAENGKKVTALLELRARFDEENNIHWASRLETAGCHVLYGPDGYKVHAKLLLITLRDGRRIAQIGTGNFNEKTVKLYTDLALITPDAEITGDAALFFDCMEEDRLSDGYRALLVAPAGLKRRLFSLIDGQTRLARAGEPSGIFLKLNSLTDKDIIDRLIAASAAGVPVRLIVRGICCLLPGVPGRTENIRILSIVGRFLEHSRVYRFGEGAGRRTYISSADLMTRNTSRRVELACPVRDERIAAQIDDMLELAFRDTVKARVLLPDGTYVRRTEPHTEPIDSQALLLSRLSGKAGKPGSK